MKRVAAACSVGCNRPAAALKRARIDGDVHRRAEGLQDDTVAFGEAKQGFDTVGRRIRREFETEANGAAVRRQG